jgi:hypothetical protein
MIAYAVSMAAVGGLLIAAATTLGSREAAANPKFAQETGKPCGFCHTAPPTLNDQGKAFKAKGNKL